MTNSIGDFSDFCVRNIGQAVAGRHEIEYAEQEMQGEPDSSFLKQENIITPVCQTIYSPL